jgi:hypothetical protein
MANLIGEGFNDYVRKQINHRQTVYGSGVSEGRTEKDITYLNSRTAWIKVASSVSLDGEDEEMAKLRRKNLDLVGEISLKKDLAKKFVLFNGVSSLNKDSGDILKQRSGILDSNTDNKSVHNSAYGMGGLEFGLQPMPGIISMDVEALNMGSLKKAILKIKAYNKEQLAILDVLYLRLGYTLLIEFGNNLYLDKNGEVQNMGTTLVEDKFFSEELIGKSYRSLLPEIEKKRLEYCGNYDAFFGRITNFSWDFNPDGSYDIQIQLYSLGDVIESLKLNQVNTRGLLTKYKNATKEQKKFIASRFKQDYQNENILEFLEQQERERNKIYEYLKEIQSLDSFKKTSENDFTRIVEVQAKQTAAINDALQSSPNYGMDSVNNDPQIQNIANAQLQFDETKKIEDIISVEVISGDRYVPKFSPDLSVPTLYYKLVPNDPGLSATFDDKTNPPITQKEFDSLGGSLDTYKNKSSNYSEVELIDFTEEYKGVTYTVKLYRFTNSFIESEKYVGSQIKLSSIEGTDLLGSSQQQNIEIGFTPINFFTNGEEYSLTSLGPLTSEIFEPTKAIQTQGTSPRNRVPFPSDFDEKIHSENNAKIFAKQEEILDKLAENKDFVKKKNKNASPSNTKVSIITTKIGKQQKPVSQEIGHIINHKIIWHENGLYKPKSKTSDHVKIKKYNPLDNSYFIRFGTFLEFIKENILYKVNNGGSKKSNIPLFQLDTDIDSNIMYTLPNHVSLDPTQAIVNVNVKSIGSNIQTFEGLEKFQNSEPFYGKIMNIYLSHDFIFEQLAANVDEKNNLILFSLLDSICSRLNVIFGGINNLHPSIDETTNCIKIYDDTPVPNLEKISEYLIKNNPTKYKFYEDITNFQWNCNTLPNQTLDYTLNLYGYKDTKSKSNFVNDVKIKTKVTKDMATMLSIGATANGYVVGEEATAFSKWNFGMTDRYYEEIVDAEYDEKIKSELAETLRKENEEIQRNYAYMIFYNFEFSEKRYYNGAHEVITNEEELKESVKEGKYPPLEANTVIQYGGGVMLPQQIEQNISSGTAFYQYLIASASAVSNNTRPVTNIQGFLPITLDVSLDGISGPKIYQKLNVDTEFLPNNYPEAMDFIIRGVSHTLQDNQWSTKLLTLATSQISNEPVYLPKFKYDIDVISSLTADYVKEGNPYKGSTSVRNFKSNSYPIIVPNEESKKEWEKYYGDVLSKDGVPFDNFLVRKGLGNPNSFSTKFTQKLLLDYNSRDGKNVRLIIKGDADLGNTESTMSGDIENQLGAGADISEDLYKALLRFWNILGNKEYEKYYPIMILGGNDKFHHGSTIKDSGNYSESEAFVKPYNTTHTRGLAIDIRQKSDGAGPNGRVRNLAIQKALKKAGFTGIVWHNPPHIHANISSIQSDNEKENKNTFNSQYSNYNQQSVSFSSF